VCARAHVCVCAHVGCLIWILWVFQYSTNSSTSVAKDLCECECQTIHAHKHIMFFPHYTIVENDLHTYMYLFEINN